MKPFEIFRTGSHVSSSGAQIEVTKSMLDTIARNYNAAGVQAPLVVGHPKTNDPAYGWVKKMEVKGDVLVAHPEQVEAEFEEMVEAGRFKNRSISLYQPTDASNPMPGVLFPRHVGFLGAHAPAIKGLKPVEFSDGADVLDFKLDFADPAVTSSQGVVDGVVSVLRRLLSGAVPGEFSQSSNFSKLPIKKEDTMSNKEDLHDFAEREAALKKKEAAIAARELEFAERAAKVRANDDQAFVNALEKAGKVPPGATAGILSFMATLEDAKTIEFSENDKTVKKSPYAFFKDMLGATKPVINFGEVSSDDGEGSDVDLGDVDNLVAAALEFQAAQERNGVVISIDQAVAHVQKQNGDQDA